MDTYPVPLPPTTTELIRSMPSGRGLTKEERRILERAYLTELRGEVIEDLGKRTMHRACNVDDFRIKVARGDPFKNLICADIEEDTLNDLRENRARGVRGL